MGGTQSTRKITVENDNSIQVSKDAIDRIQSQLNQKLPQPQPIHIQQPHPVHYKQNMLEIPAVVGDGLSPIFALPPVSIRKPLVKDNSAPIPEQSLEQAPPMKHPAILQPPSPPFIPVPENENYLRSSAVPPPAAEAASVPFSYPDYLDSKRKYYAEEEAYWTKRIDNLKRKHESINSGLKAEYQKTLKQATELFETVQKEEVMKLPPCQAEVKNILSCYKTNSGKTLACTGAVTTFMECVAKSKSKNVA